MSETFASFTPPKYVQRLQEKDRPVLLEERLAHFMEWFQKRCWPIEPHEAKGAFDRDEAIKALIEEYVNE